LVYSSIFLTSRSFAELEYSQQAGATFENQSVSLQQARAELAGLFSAEIKSIIHHSATMTQNPDLVKKLSILCPLLFNWLDHIQFIESHCQDHHGLVGHAIVNGEHITLPVKPQESDLDSRKQKIYDTDANGQLSSRGEMQFDAAVTHHYKLYDQHVSDDVAAFQFIRSPCSDKSIARAEQKSSSYEAHWPRRSSSYHHDIYLI
jgi:hypothetical protein